MGIGILTNADRCAKVSPMRRKPGTLLKLERAILDVGLQLRQEGTGTFHGFQIANQIKVRGVDDRNLAALGTLYRALARMERDGLLESRWEDPPGSTEEERPGPRRRLYDVTAAGEAKLAEAITVAAQVPHGLASELAQA